MTRSHIQSRHLLHHWFLIHPLIIALLRKDDSPFFSDKTWHKSLSQELFKMQNVKQNFESKFVASKIPFTFRSQFKEFEHFGVSTFAICPFLGWISTPSLLTQEQSCKLGNLRKLDRTSQTEDKLGNLEQILWAEQLKFPLH